MSAISSSCFCCMANTCGCSGNNLSFKSCMSLACFNLTRSSLSLYTCSGSISSFNCANVILCCFFKGIRCSGNNLFFKACTSSKCVVRKASTTSSWLTPICVSTCSKLFVNSNKRCFCKISSASAALRILESSSKCSSWAIRSATRAASASCASWSNLRRFFSL